MPESERVVDAGERERALDPRGSFIVQAPAGSGKTELLIQRLLGLLAIVAKPEEIAAITFTRKAAAEMRRRVFTALADARSRPCPALEHEAKTWRLARAALEQDARQGWSIEASASRLRIQTFDSLCASLTRQMPVLAKFGSQPATVEKPDALHREAARETLARIDGSDALADDVATLLAHFDNDVAQVEELLAGILRRREHWLRYLGPRIDRAALEAALGDARRDAVDRAAAALAEAGLAAPAGAGAVDPDDWIAFANEHLTKDRKWRARSDIGKAMQGGEGPVLDALRELQALPPAAYREDQWAVLESFARVAREAVAHLKVVFAARGEADFAEIAQGALAAVGTPEEPTDLLLALDYRIRHLLVDEFQDTSFTQVELLGRLTAGWEPGDGRTLFVVGDPMQSIYRFREAEVGLFLRARREGIGSVRLEPLRLAANFRSHAGIVEWVNSTFGRVMPAREDIAAGAVSYSPSTAVHGADGDAVAVHAFFDDDKAGEAALVARLAQEALADPCPDPAKPRRIAILVRARPALAAIVPALKARGLRFRAVEIDPLGERPVVRDLLALTRALSHLADRTAWLAVLRAPWCGLTLADLHQLAGDAGGRERGEVLLEALRDGKRVARLSADGRERLAPALAVLERALERTGLDPLRSLVEGTWLALGGPACVETQAAFGEADAYLDHLEASEVAGALPDLAEFEESLGELYAPPDESAGPRLEVMTIHKAKGLEFDTVIVPGLGAGSANDERRMFLWLERARSGRGGRASDLLLAPVHATGEDEDPIYRYLRALEREKGDHELGRLLYVAATRAKRRLHLVGIAKAGDSKEPGVPKARKGSSLAKLWPVVGREFARRLAEPRAGTDTPAPGTVTTGTATRRTASFALPPPPPGVDWRPAMDEDRDEESIEFSWVTETTRLAGTVVHRWLQRIAEEGLEGWDEARVRSLRARVRVELRQRGVLDADGEEAASRVERALLTALADAKGRWILGPHPWSRCEYRVTALVGGRRRRFAMDRVFREADGTRWIVDYKSGLREGAGAEAFLDGERERYATKMRDYARALGSGSKAALYFPLVPGWREID